MAASVFPPTSPAPPGLEWESQQVERQVSFLPSPSRVPPSSWFERRERRWQPTRALFNLTSNLSVFMVHTEEEVTGGTWIKAPQAHTYVQSAHAQIDTHTHAQFLPTDLKFPLKFSASQPAQPSLQLVPLCMCVCVCAYECILVFIYSESPEV